MLFIDPTNGSVSIKLKRPLEFKGHRGDGAIGSDPCLSKRKQLCRSPRLCKTEIPSIVKGGDYVKFTNATPETFAATATGIVPALASCCP